MSGKEYEFCQIVQEETKHSSKPKSSLTKTGAVILGISGACFVGIYALAAPFLTPALRKICLPFVPATTDQVKNVFTVLKGRSGTLIDIGSGDGRIVIEAARRGFTACGVELNYWLVLYSRWSAWRNGVAGTARFIKQDLWKMTPIPCQPVDGLYLFGHVDEMLASKAEGHEFEFQFEKVMVATCSSSGIGRGIAEELVRTGYAVTLHGRNKASLDSTAEMCLAAGCDENDILCVHGDLSKDNDLEAIPAMTMKKFGRIDALVNNAGEAFHPDKMAVFDANLFDRILTVNLRAPVVLSKLTLEYLRATQGCILNISSVSVDNHKKVLLLFVLTAEVAPLGVRVNCIKPGALMTPVWGRFGTLTEERKKQLEDTLTNYFHPLRRLTSQEDIDHAVTFMLSEKANFITGAIIPVTGGAHMPYDGRVLQYQEQSDMYSLRLRDLGQKQ